MSEQSAAPQGDEPVETVEASKTELIENPEKVWGLYEKKKAESASLRSRVGELEQLLQRTQEEAMSENEKATAKAVKDAIAQVEAQYQDRLKAERLIRMASGKLADPADVISLIDTSDIDVDDEAAMLEAIDRLVESKPYLAAKQQRQVPQIDQGPQGGAPQPQDDPNDWLRRAIGHPTR